MGTKHGIDPVERVLMKCSYEHGCWVFKGGRNPRGYGLISVGGRKGGSLGSHRVVFEALVGPIPEGMQIDHLCRNPSCCNPMHLEVVSPRENMLRGSLASNYASSTHCKHGHAYDDVRSARRSARAGRRICVPCETAKSMKWQRKANARNAS